MRDSTYQRTLSVYLSNAAAGFPRTNRKETTDWTFGKFRRCTLCANLSKIAAGFPRTNRKETTDWTFGNFRRYTKLVDNQNLTSRNRSYDQNCKSNKYGCAEIAIVFGGGFGVRSHGRVTFEIRVQELSVSSPGYKT